jgi:hypothetical protein
MLLENQYKGKDGTREESEVKTKALHLANRKKLD